LSVSFVSIKQKEYNGGARWKGKGWAGIIVLFENAWEGTMIIFETEQLQFRPLTTSDLDDLAALYADPEVMRFLGGPRSKDEVQRVLSGYFREYSIYGDSFFAILQKSDQRFIGYCALLKQEVEGEL